MSKSAITRMFWKEYRSQRVLWLALMIGLVVLQATFFTMSPSERHSNSGFPIWVALAVLGCYLAASGAILFAGERDGDTDRFLRSLPLSISELVSGKLFYGISGGLAFATAAAVLTLVVYFPWIRESSWSTPFTPGPGEQLLFTFGLLLCAFSYMTLASVLFNKVLVAFTAGAAAFVGMLILQTSFVRLEYNPVRASVLWLGTGGLALLTTAALTPAWYTSGETSLWQAWTRRLSIGNRRRPVWRYCLHWSASRVSPLARSMSVIALREARYALPFSLLYLAVCCVIFFPVGWFVTKSTVQFHFLAMIVVPLLVGLRVFAHDQRHREMQFLGDRGISPTLIWGTKQAIWLTTAALMVWISWQFLRFDDWVFYEPERKELPNLVDALTTLLWTSDVKLASFVTVAGWWILVTYSIGQVLSLWFRNALLPLLIALMAIFLSLSTQMLFYTLGVPLWVLWGPLVIAAFVATYGLMPVWLNQSKPRRILLRRIGGCLAVICVTFLAVETHRVWSIPLTEPGFDWKTLEATMADADPKWSNDWQNLLAPDDPVQLKLNSDQVLNKYLSWENRESARFQEVRALQAARSERQVELMQRLVEHPDLKLDPAFGADIKFRDNAGALIYGTQQLAVVLLHEGDVEGSWRLLNTNFRTLNYFSRNLFDLFDLWGWLHRYRTALKEVRAWAQHPNQTPELLQAAADFLAAQPDYVSVRDSIQKRYVYARQVIEHRGWGWKQYAPRNDSYRRAATFPSNLFTWAEERRLLRLINQAAQARASNGPFPSDRWLTDTSAAAAAYRDSEATPLARENPFTWTHPDVAPDDVELVTTTAMQLNATRVLIALEQYRLQQDNYPETLADLVGEFLPQLPRDPTNAGDFHYTRWGFAHPLVFSQWTGGHPIPAEQPLLWSAGNLNPQVVFQKSAKDPSTQAEIRRSNSLSTEVAVEEQLRLLLPLSARAQRLIDDDPDGVYVYKLPYFSPSGNPYHGPAARTDDIQFFQLRYRVPRPLDRLHDSLP